MAAQAPIPPTGDASETVKRDDGMALAAGAAPALWLDYAYRVLCDVAREQPTVHVDDVEPRLTWKAEAHPNARGTLWKRALREGVLGEVVGLRATTLPGKHRHRSPVYRSLVYRQLKGAA